MLQPGNVPVILAAIDRQYENTVDLRNLVGTDATAFNSYTVVVKIKASENLVGGTKCRLAIRAPNTTTCAWTAMYFGQAASSGNAYDFATTPVQVLFGGLGGLTVQQQKTVMSDPINLEYNPAKAHVLAINVSGTTLRRLTSTTTRGVVSYYRAATSEASTVSKTSGYTAQANTSLGLSLIQAWRAVDL